MTSGYEPRLADETLKRRLRYHPAVLVVGPRATGKTTTAERLANSVVRLDEPGQAVVAAADPDALLRGLPEPVLIDEWQIAPEILGAVKRAVDADPRPGRYIVTGSVRGDVDSPTWPGTGRLIRIAMYGMTVGEIHGVIPTVPLLDRLAEHGIDGLTDAMGDEYDLRGYLDLAAMGGFPQPALRLPPSERSRWFSGYIDQLLTRDVVGVGAHPTPSSYVDTWRHMPSTPRE